MEGQSDSKQFPIGTIIYYGPDAETTTKITASVIEYEGAEPIRRQWDGEGVTTDPQVISELGQFFKDNGVQRVIMTNKNAGCPHVEGIDYPAGEDCPYCPYWKGKQ